MKKFLLILIVFSILITSCDSSGVKPTKLDEDRAETVLAYLDGKQVNAKSTFWINSPGGGPETSRILSRLVDRKLLTPEQWKEARESIFNGNFFVQKQ